MISPIYVHFNDGSDPLQIDTEKMESLWRKTFPGNPPLAEITAVMFMESMAKLMSIAPALTLPVVVGQNRKFWCAVNVENVKYVAMEDGSR